MAPKHQNRSRPKKNAPGRHAQALLAWYDAHARDLPWRAKPAQRPDPYHVWLSEIMLQQTTVAAVIPYFHKFLQAWPRIEDLANAPLADVLAAWAGLGYYARARNLHACARQIADAHSGAFPQDEVALRKLPGIGAYTSAAIAAIAFGHRAVVVDGNVERVIARLYALETPLPKSKAEIHVQAEKLTPQMRPGDFAQGMMDLGATLCTPRAPRCVQCPLQRACKAHAAGNPEAYPRRLPRAARPERRAHAFVALNAAARILLQERPMNGLLGGMLEPPMSEWRAVTAAKPGGPVPPFAASWQKCKGRVRHVFTHFALEVDVYVANGIAGQGHLGTWHRLETLDALALPSLMRKIIAHALEALAAK